MLCGMTGGRTDRWMEDGGWTSNLSAGLKHKNTNNGCIANHSYGHSVGTIVQRCINIMCFHSNT